MFATDETVGLAEWIIDDICLVISYILTRVFFSFQISNLRTSFFDISFTLVLALNKKSNFFHRPQIIHLWKEKLKAPTGDLFKNKYWFLVVINSNNSNNIKT